MQKTVGDELQIIGKDNYDAMFRSYGEMNKGFQAIVARWAEFSKRSFEDATRTWEHSSASSRSTRPMKSRPITRRMRTRTGWPRCRSRRDVFVHRTRRLQAGREDDGEA